MVSLLHCDRVLRQTQTNAGAAAHCHQSSLANCQEDKKLRLVFSERERSLYVVARPSVVCLSCRLSVTFVHPTQAIEIFGNVSTPFNTLAI